MDIIISARHMELTDSMRYNVETSLDKIKHSHKLNKAEVVLDADHNKFIAEIVLHGNKINLEAKAETANMAEAIDKAAERLQKQLDKKFNQRVNGNRQLSLGQAEAEHVEALSLAASEEE